MGIAKLRQLRQGLGALSRLLPSIPEEVFEKFHQNHLVPTKCCQYQMPGTRNPQTPTAIKGWWAHQSGTHQGCRGPAVEVRSNPKTPAVCPGPGLGTKAIVPPCKAHRKSRIGINGALLHLDPQALSQADCFGGDISEKGPHWGTAPLLWSAGFSPWAPEPGRFLSQRFPPSAASPKLAPSE